MLMWRRASGDCVMRVLAKASSLCHRALAMLAQVVARTWSMESSRRDSSSLVTRAASRSRNL
eukprot:7107957-Heterocapsa_arctica.AAC.1